MILATDLPDGNVQVIFVDDSVPNGSKLDSPFARGPFVHPRRSPKQVGRLDSCPHQWAYPAHTRAYYFTMRGAAPLCAPQSGGTPPHPHGWAYPAHTRGSFRFHDERNQRRAGAAPLDPASAKRPPSLVLRCRLHPGYFLPQTQTDLPLWVGGQIGLCFSPKLYRGSHPQLSIRGTAGLASRMLEGLSYRNQYR